MCISLDVAPAPEVGGVPAQEKGEEDVIGRQFVSESVIRSLTLGGVLDHGILHGRVTTTGEYTGSQLFLFWN